MEVRISGCVFASHFLELANSKGDIEGFLLGEVSSRTTNTVSDSHDIAIKKEQIFAVQEILVCRGLFSFYDGVGRIHTEKLNSILGDKKQFALGWFKYRRHSRLQISMREKAVYRNLMEQLNIQKSQKFIFTIFKSNHTPNLSTHRFQYSACYCLPGSRVFTGIPVAIVNLGNTAQTEYKQSIEPTRSTSKQYKNVIGSFKDEFLDNIGQLQQVKHTHSMYTSILGKLKDLAKVVRASESKLSSVSQQVERLREELESTIQAKRNQGDTEREPELIVLDDDEEDLICFDEPKAAAAAADAAAAKKTEKVVVVAKHISISPPNSVSNEHSSPFTDIRQKIETRSRPEPVESLDGHEEGSLSDSPVY